MELGFPKNFIEGTGYWFMYMFDALLTNTCSAGVGVCVTWSQVVGKLWSTGRRRSTPTILFGVTLYMPLFVQAQLEEDSP